MNLLLASYGILPPKQILPEAKKSAERALELDPTLCEPYCTLGYYYASVEWNWAEAKKNFLKALEINPRYAEGHYRYGWTYLTCIEGKFEEGENHGRIAIQVEPLNSICFANYSLILHTAGKFAQSLAVSEMGIELDPNSFLCHLSAGITNIALKNFDQANASLLAAQKLASTDLFTIHGRIWALCLTKRFEEARVLMEEIKERSKTEYVANTLKGLSAGYLGDFDAAFEYLEKAYDDRDPMLLVLKYEWWVPDSLRADPRFQDLVNRIDFPG